MHPQISAFPSRLFYDSKLQDGPGMGEIRKAMWHADPLLSPYRFFNVNQGKEQQRSGGKSVYNPEEVEACAALIYKLCVSFPEVNV